MQTCLHVSMNEENKAIEQHVAVPPSVLEAVAEDPTAAQPIHRAQAMKLSHELFTRRSTMTVAQQMQLMESLAKLGNLAPKANAEQLGPGSGVSINIVLPGHKEKSITIDAAAIEVETSNE